MNIDTDIELINIFNDYIETFFENLSNFDIIIPKIRFRQGPQT
jgi:hypothetical protein